MGERRSRFDGVSDGTMTDPMTTPLEVYRLVPRFHDDFKGALLGATLLKAVRDRFAGTGHFIPVNVPGLPAGTYTAYVPSTVADCLDEARSSAPELTGKIRQAVFRGDRVPVDVPAFRLPENRTYVYWNAWAAHLIEEAAPSGSVELRLVWSSDPTATPHRDPMGFQGSERNPTCGFSSGGQRSCAVSPSRSGSLGPRRTQHSPGSGARTAWTPLTSRPWR